MRRSRLNLFIPAALLALASLTQMEASEMNSTQLYPAIQTYIEETTGQFDQIDAERKSLLRELADFVAKKTKSGEPVQLTFICTHNSRRSHLSQVWAQTAAAYYGVKNVQSYSGGTEATAFNPRAVAALERAGFHTDKTTDAKNPIYHVRYHENAMPMTAFSKVYSDAPNPNEHFCAIMTCSSADKACPAVLGAEVRVAIPFEDPKISDDTPAEAETYDERCRQIAREMLYVFSLVK